MSNKKIKNKASKGNLSVSSIAVFGFAAAMALTGAPSLSNSASNFISSSPIVANIPYNKDEEDMRQISCTKTNINTEFSASVSQGTEAAYSEVNDQENIYGAVAFDNLYYNFICEIDRHQDYLSVNKSEAILSFVTVARKIANIPYLKASVDLLPEDGFKFVLKLAPAKILMASKYIENSGNQTNNLVVSLFENRKIVRTEIMDADKIVETYSA